MDATKLGKFEVRGTLGRGAMGLVYEGWDPVIARRVAIKTVRLPDTSDSEAMELLARFRREAQAAGRLNHPNVVGVFDYGETDEIAFIVMEFIDGKSLKAVLEAREILPLPEIARIMASLLAGLQYSHDNGVVHRDIKPANIMLTVQGQVKIADFGIARIESSSMTQTGAVLGTPAYMSPEQFMGQQVDRRTDIYSSGVVLYQMLTGERPFEGGMSSVMHKALNTTPPRPSDLSVIAPPAFDAVVAKAMAKRPQDRFDSAAAFARALHAAMDGATAGAGDDDATRVARRLPAATVGAAPAPAAAKPAENGGSRTPIGVAFAAVGLIAVAGTAWYWSPWRASDRPAALPSQTLPHDVGALPAPSAPLPQETNATPVPAPPLVSPQAPAPPAAAPQATETVSAALQPTQTVTATPQIETLSPAPAAPSPAPATTSSPAPEAVASASPPVPAAPAPGPSPAFDLAGARALARSVPCSLLDVEAGRHSLSGFAQPGAEFDSFLGRLRERYGPISDESFQISPVFCEALAAVRDTVWDSRDHGRAIDLIIPDTPVPVDGRFNLGARSIGNAAIYVDLFDEAGGVQHVIRRRLPPGNVTNVQETTRVDKPGRYVVIAIATPMPLDLAQRAVHETAALYLPVLEQELARLSAAGAGTVRADVAPVAVVAAARPAVPPNRQSPAAAALSRAPGLNASRCADIVARAQLGEGISDADRTALRTSCRR